MPARRKSTPDWQKFERLVARIEADVGLLGLIITSPDRLRCKVTGRLREVDASVRTKVGTANVLITIECRKRSPKQDVTWIEQLVTKRNNLGAARTIAVSSTGFSKKAEVMALHHGIELRKLADVSAAELNRLLQLDFVLFPHKRCSVTQVAVRWFRSMDWKLPDPDTVDHVLALDDIEQPIFKITDTGRSWSVHDLWCQLLEAADPFAGLKHDGNRVVRTACFPYPGNVTLEMPEGPKLISDVLLSVALAIDVEQMGMDSAKKVEYVGQEGETLQRVEFSSKDTGREDWRISLQLPKHVATTDQLRTRLDVPKMDAKRKK